MLNLRKEKILCTEVAKIYGKNESSISEVVKEKEICASMLLNLKLQVMATMLDKCLVRMEKALRFKIF